MKSLFFRQMLLILKKDLVVERRAKEIFPQMFAFAVLIIVILNLATQIGTPLQDLLPGFLWIMFTFAGMLGLNHSFLVERENQGLQGILLCPVKREAIYLGKVLGNFLFMSMIELILLPIVIVLFNLSVGVYLLRLEVVLALGTFGFVSIGTLFAAMSTNTKIREVLLPLLVFPIVIPILIVAVKATGAILTQHPLSEIMFWIQFLCVFDGLFFGLSMLTFDYIVESE